MRAVPSMPRFDRPEHGFHHTVDSALESLGDLGVSPLRITIRMAGRGWPTRWIVGQEPAAGQALTPDRAVTLNVAGTGLFHGLPVGMWDKGTEAEPGTAELVELIDDPLQKAAHWVREGARLFDIRRDNLPACARWISLFGLSADAWPPEIWYDLAVLLPGLHRLAGRPKGIHFSLGLLLRLPLERVDRRPHFAWLAEDSLSLMGVRNGRLGVDLIVGDRREDLACWVLRLGPVPLDTYRRFQEPAPARQLRSVLQLCLPCYQRYEVSWTVLDPSRPVRLGVADENAVLGVNAHLGAGKGTVPAGETAASSRRVV